MGLVICLATFAAGFAATVGAAMIADVYLLNRAAYFDPEGVMGHEGEIVAVVASLVVLSALFGARQHQVWLGEHPGSAARSGSIAGVLTAAVLLAFGAISTWANGAVAAAALVIARFTFPVWPAAIAHFVIAATRRRQALRKGHGA